MTALPNSNNLNAANPDKVYKGYPTLCRVTPDLIEYLETSRLVLERALQSHPNTLFVKISLRTSHHYKGSDKKLISRFFNILASEIHDYVRLRRHFVWNTPESQIGYLWALKYNFSYGHSFLVYLFVNQNTFNSLNDCSAKVGGLKTLLQNSWAMALNTTLQEGQSLVVFPLQARDCLLKANDDKSSVDARNEVFAKISGNALSDTKGSSSSEPEFGGSNTP